jgi:biotin--protein ligase
MSVCIRYPMAKLSTSPVVFIQYLAAMAVVQGIKSYAKGYEEMPVKLKWPNDICKSRQSTILRFHPSNAW